MIGHASRQISSPRFEPTASPSLTANLNGFSDRLTASLATPQSSKCQDLFRSLFQYERQLLRPLVSWPPASDMLSPIDRDATYISGLEISGFIYRHPVFSTLSTTESCGQGSSPKWITHFRDNWHPKLSLACENDTAKQNFESTELAHFWSASEFEVTCIA